ncbi:3400_t:CDS:2 [Racocetra fulgida]|uniref:3400_t:CDS:1 n=1 Tax=Racocetra fulgida TaxID=60492 RepID=A0A9N9D0G3_9GLOM|nr:3400_t:CDS:2 [Racocetra fulgida]
MKYLEELCELKKKILVLKMSNKILKIRSVTEDNALFSVKNKKKDISFVNYSSSKMFRKVCRFSKKFIAYSLKIESAVAMKEKLLLKQIQVIVIGF